MSGDPTAVARRSNGALCLGPRDARLRSPSWRRATWPSCMFLESPKSVIFTSAQEQRSKKAVWNCFLPRVVVDL